MSSVNVRECVTLLRHLSWWAYDAFSSGLVCHCQCTQTIFTEQKPSTQMKIERKIADTSEINTQTVCVRGVACMPVRICVNFFGGQFYFCARWHQFFSLCSPNISHIRHYFRTINFTRCPNHIPKWDNKKVKRASHQASKAMHHTNIHACPVLGGLSRSWLH